jgi:hypothetical protein
MSNEESIGQLMLDIAADNSILLSKVEDSNISIEGFSHTVETSLIQAADAGSAAINGVVDETQQCFQTVEEAAQHGGIAIKETAEAYETVEDAAIHAGLAVRQAGTDGLRFGTSVVAGGKQASEAVEDVGRHVKTTGEKMEAAFGTMHWTHLLGAYALLRTAGLALEGFFAELGASAELAAAQLSGSYEDILGAQLKVAEAHEQMVRAVPILGGIIAGAMRHYGDREGIEQALKNMQEIVKGTEQMEKEAVRLHRETVLEKARLDGRSEADLMKIRFGTELDDLRESLKKQSEIEVTAAAEGERARQAAVEALRKESGGNVHGTFDLKRLQEEKKRAQAYIDSMRDIPGGVSSAETDLVAAIELYEKAERERTHIIDAETQLRKAIAEKEATDKATVAAKQEEEKQKKDEKATSTFIKQFETQAKAVETWVNDMGKYFEKYNKYRENIAKQQVKDAAAVKKAATEDEKAREKEEKAREKGERDAEKSLEDSLKVHKVKLETAGALEKGSQAAWAAVHKTGVTPEQETAKNTKATAVAVQTTAKNTSRIVDLLPKTMRPEMGTATAIG